jgi:hypothetical protein
LFFSDEDFMDNVTFSMDLLRLASAIAQEDQLPSPAEPAVANALAQLASLESPVLSAVETGSGQ